MNKLRKSVLKIINRCIHKVNGFLTWVLNWSDYN